MPITENILSSLKVNTHYIYDNAVNHSTTGTVNYSENFNIDIDAYIKLLKYIEGFTDATLIANKKRIPIYDISVNSLIIYKPDAYLTGLNLSKNCTHTIKFLVDQDDYENTPEFRVSGISAIIDTATDKGLREIHINNIKSIEIEKYIDDKVWISFTIQPDNNTVVDKPHNSLWPKAKICFDIYRCAPGISDKLVTMINSWYIEGGTIRHFPGEVIGHKIISQEHLINSEQLAKMFVNNIYSISGTKGCIVRLNIESSIANTVSGKYTDKISFLPNWFDPELLIQH